MVLIDTSVWIRFLANHAPYAQELEKFLALDEVAGHEPVYGELLIRGAEGDESFLAVYERIHQARAVPHRELVEFVRSRNLHGHCVGWIDIHLLASALVGRCSLWTADSRLSMVAAELGIAYGSFRSTEAIF